MVERLIGFSMRIYRRSPFYPGLGSFLGRLLWISRAGRKRVVEKTLRGNLRFRLYLDEVIDSSLYYSGTFEADAEKRIEEALRPGMVAVDVGANVGYHALRMAKAVGPLGKVVAIEPTRHAVERLRENVELNVLPSLVIVQVALGDTDSGVKEMAFKSSYRLDGKSTESVEPVEILTLDSLLERMDIPKVDFIKCDVDGFEAKVFRGSRKILERDRPTLFFEVTPSEMIRLGDDPRQFFGHLMELGYAFQDEKGRAVPDWQTVLAAIPHGSSTNLLAVVHGRN